MAEETQYTANTGLIRINAANRNLNGTGTLGTLLTGAANGTLVKSITIKAVGDTSLGMIRLFVYDGASTVLYKEISIPKNAKSSVNKTFEMKMPLNLNLESNYVLKVSTEKSEAFNIIAEGMNKAYYASSVRADTTQIFANTGRANIAIANSNYDGTGTLGTVFTAGTSSTYKGSSVRTITIKSPANITSGMVRLFLKKGESTFLFKEITADTLTKSALDSSFEHTIVYDDDFDLEADVQMLASTQVAEKFWVTVQGTNWNYVA